MREPAIEPVSSTIQQISQFERQLLESNEEEFPVNRSSFLISLCFVFQACAFLHLLETLLRSRRRQPGYMVNLAALDRRTDLFRKLFRDVTVAVASFP